MLAISLITVLLIKLSALFGEFMPLWYLKPGDTDLFCAGSCDLLCLWCQSAVIEFILIPITENNTMLLTPEHREGNHRGTCVCTGALPAASGIPSTISLKIKPR